MKTRFREVNHLTYTDAARKLVGQCWNTRLSASNSFSFFLFSLHCVPGALPGTDEFGKVALLVSVALSPPCPHKSHDRAFRNTGWILHHHSITNLDATFPTKELKLLCSKFGFSSSKECVFFHYLPWQPSNKCLYHIHNILGEKSV